VPGQLPEKKETRSLFQTTGPSANFLTALARQDRNYTEKKDTTDILISIQYFYIKAKTL